MKEQQPTPLRQRMIGDLRTRGMAETAEAAQIRAVKDFAVFLRRSPDTATPEEPRAYQPSLLVVETRLNSKGRAAASKSKTGRGLAIVPIFLFVPQVKLPKRLSPDGPARETEARMPGLIVEKWVEGRLV